MVIIVLLFLKENLYFLFRYIGFVPKEEVVNNRKVVNVQMVEDVGQLDEVVVVAYGAQKKERVCCWFYHND